MKKPEPVIEQPKSEKIAGLIVETENRLTALDKELEAFDTQQDLVVGAETLDQEALTSLCARQAATETEHRALIRRLAVLAEQKTEAERQEAGMRLQAIVAEAERLAEAQAPARAAYDDAVDVLTQTMSALVELHREHSELGLETVYWMEKYRFPRPSVPQLGELPDLNSLVTTLSQMCASLFHVSLDSEWSRKRQMLNRHSEQRQQPRAEPVPVQARNPEERSAARTIPVKPDHEEDHRPNKLQQLLRSN